MEIVPLSALRDNYIWALVRGRRCAVVDPGEAAPVISFLAQHGLTLDAILITHRHNDHTGAIAALCGHAGGVPVFGPTHELIAGVTRPLRDGDQIVLADDDGPLTLDVLDVPGHTEGHIAYLTQGALFCGDTLFGGGCGRLMGGTAAQFHASLTRLAALPATTRVCCAHEYTLANLRFACAVEPDNPAITARRTACEVLRAAGQPTLPSTIGEEIATNPFLRYAVPAVKAAAEAHCGAGLPDDKAVFTALRAWKDVF